MFKSLSMPRKQTSKETTQELSSRDGVIYAPFVSGDTIYQTMGPNLSRKNKGKELYPIICRSNKDKALFEKYRQDFIQRFTKKIDFIDEVDRLVQKGATKAVIRQAFGPEAFDKAMNDAQQLSREIDVVVRMDVRSNEDRQELTKLRPEKHKLYIIGHGGPGMNILAADEGLLEGKVTAKDLAQQLYEGGLSPAFSDFRVNACNSADTRLPLSFNSKDLKEATKPDICRLFGKREIKAEPFAQTLSNELKNVGFQHPDVAGYHGAGVTISHKEHHYRRLEDNQESDVRSSTVRKRFTPE